MDESGEQSRTPGGRVARVAPFVGMAGRTAGEAVVASLRNRRHGTSDNTAFHTRQAERYAERLGHSRGVLMKAGQMVSFISLDPAVDTPYRGIYQAAFARLQDDAPPMPVHLATEIIAAELGRPAEQIFPEFDPHPLAAASIGQVHAATLPDGRRVAVKVQYPGAEEAIRADLKNTELLATFLRLMLTVMPSLSRMDARAMAREISERIGEEIDYRIEARNQQQFADAYRGHPFIRIPEVLPEFSTRRVLTMDLVHGLRYADALTAEQSLRDKWGEVIFRFQWANLLSLGLFNADPHPGNYLFHPEDGSVTFLDFGCVKRFTTAQTAQLAELIQACLDEDADRLLRAAVEMKMVDPQDLPEADALLDWLSGSGEPFLGPQPFTYTPEFVAVAMRLAASPRGPHAAVIKKLSHDGGDFVLISRLEAGVNSVLAGLHATGPWRAIRDEYWSDTPPATPYGEADAAHRQAH